MGLGAFGIGRPSRPINIGHGKHVIQWNRTEPWVRREIYNKIDKVAEGDGWIEEHTGLHECEFIETRRHWFTKASSSQNRWKCECAESCRGT